MKEDRRKRWRRLNPYRYKYQGSKHTAKQRGIPFDLSFVEFLGIPKIDWYVLYDGPRQAPDSPSLDRILPLSKEPRGYTKGNVQVITLSENARKRWKEYDQLPYRPEGVPF